MKEEKVHTKCKGCRYEIHENMERFLLSPSAYENTGEKCRRCYSWSSPECRRVNWESGKKIVFHYKCEGCVRQTWEDMEEYLAGPAKPGFFKEDLCDSCYLWQHPERIRWNYEPYKPTKKKKDRKGGELEQV